MLKLKVKQNIYVSVFTENCKQNDICLTIKKAGLNIFKPA